MSVCGAVCATDSGCQVSWLHCEDFFALPFSSLALPFSPFFRLVFPFYTSPPLSLSLSLFLSIRTDDKESLHRGFVPHETRTPHTARYTLVFSLDTVSLVFMTIGFLCKLYLLALLLRAP